jgi:putative ABC transport system permease protein
MTLLSLALAGLRDNRLSHLLSVLMLGIGLGTVTLLLLFSGTLADRLGRDARDIDLVVGAKGSPLQLVLSTVFQADIPTGNIPLAEAEALAANRQVRLAVQLALGDAVGAFRIVGTSPAYLTLYDAHLADGRLWQKPMEAVLGASAAARLRLKPGDSFVGAHGLQGEGHLHADHPYVVTGILAESGTVLDRLVLTAVDSVWEVHEHHHHHDADHDDDDDGDGDGDAERAGREVTAVLIQYASPVAAISLPRHINLETPMQAASPGFEIARIYSLVGVGLDAFRALAASLILTSGLSVFVALYERLRARRYDLAVMRLLGASRRQLLVTILLEGVLLAGAGAAFGLLLGHAGVLALHHLLPAGHAFAVVSSAWRVEEWLVPALAAAVGLVASIIPALAAYRCDVSAALAGAEV